MSVYSTGQLGSSNPYRYADANLSKVGLKCPDIVFEFIQRGTSYEDYFKENGWKEATFSLAKVVGVGLTLFSGLKAAEHNSKVPANAPEEMMKVHDYEGGEIEIKVINHPEARLANAWGGLALTLGIASAVGLTSNIIAYFQDLDLSDLFFDVSQKFESSNPILKLIAPEFDQWRINKMKKNLFSNPAHWQVHIELSQMKCELTKDFRLFPVVAHCGHKFDWRSIRCYQLKAISPLECPQCEQKPNYNLHSLQFDHPLFNRIQSLIQNLK